MIIYLIRHAEPKVCDGKYFESNLSPMGVEKTKELARSSILSKPDIIFSSPYNRGIGTAKIFSEHFAVDFEIVDGLKEWNLQSLNLQEEYVDQEQKGWADHNHIVLGGESLNNLKQRILGCIDELTKKYDSVKTMLVVSHGTVIDMFCSAVSGREAKISDIKNMKHLDYAIVEFSGKKFKLVKDIID